MLQDRIVTQSFMMPAALYLKLLVKIVLVSFLAVLGIFTDNAVYVAVILFLPLFPLWFFTFSLQNLPVPMRVGF